MAALKQRVYESAIVVERVDEAGEVVRPQGVKRATLRLGQALVERGITPPWALSREQCQELWAGQGGDSSNAPSAYAEKDTAIVDFMNDFWAPEVAPPASVLEIGPNAGTNLNRLRELGFDRLAGVEINPGAVSEMERAYPELARRAEIRTGAMEEVLAAMEPRSADVVFSMGVLMHVHPTSTSVFRDMVRIARGFVCVIEVERASNSYVFPRDYGRVFARLRCEEIRRTEITRTTNPHVDAAYDGSAARLFRVPGV